MKVLVGVDGSTGSFEAVRQVGQLTAAADAIALYYAPPTFRVPRGSPIDPHVVGRARNALARAVFDEARQQLPSGHGAVEEIVGVQDPRHGLLLAADECHADWIAVGARGIGPMQRLLLGSVSTSIVHAARRPVLVARRGPERQAAQDLRVLLACDGSPASQHAGDFVKQLSWPSNASGRVITVVESLLGGEVPEWLEEQARTDDSEALSRAWIREHEEQLRSRRQELAGYCHELPLPFRAAEPLVVEGHPAAQILRTITAQSIDMVVLGARDLGMAQRLLAGSTSDKVLAHAPCSVLIVRQLQHP
jgi:nucleotide-binding universal stress UspA family protein